jgi:hypothetical protein
VSLGTLDVIWIYDGTTRPPKPRMVVCIEPDLGWFYRINTKARIPAILLRKSDCPFLDHDSYLECGAPLEIDETIVDEALRYTGQPIGRLPATSREALRDYFRDAVDLSVADKKVLIAALA